jgi:phosphate transport system substrate-binding protein
VAIILDFSRLLKSVAGVPRHHRRDFQIYVTKIRFSWKLNSDIILLKALCAKIRRVIGGKPMKYYRTLVRVSAVSLVMIMLMLMMASCVSQGPQPEDDPKITALENELRESFPLTDGSTSTRPLDDAFRNAIFGEDHSEAVHTTTYDSFENLINGKCDVIFSVPISEEQQARAEGMGVELEQYAISKEAFVFVINAKNPVSSISRDELRDIYSGKITNWKDLGGDDAEIIAFQRNPDSGSQNYMLTFMEGRKLTDAPETMRPGTMGALMDAVATFDGAEYSIGYSYYAYAANMYGTGNELKFVAVDGVYPDDTTIGNDTYPLISRNYAILRKDSPESARRLVEWILSEKGQSVVSENGYFSLTGNTSETAYVLGTGPERPSEAYSPDRYYQADTLEGNGVIRDGQIRYLKNKDAEKKINELLFGAGELGYVWIFNGYLAISFEKTVNEGPVPSYERFERKLIDLRTGETVEELSDLFWKGTDFFRHIHEDTFNLFGKEIDYYDEVQVSDIMWFCAPDDFSKLCDLRYFIPARPYDMADLWEDGVEITERHCRIEGNTGKETERGIVCSFGPESALGESDIERINAFVESYVLSDENYAEILIRFREGFSEYYENADEASPSIFRVIAVPAEDLLIIKAEAPMLYAVDIRFDLKTLMPAE